MNKKSLTPLPSALAWRTLPPEDYAASLVADRTAAVEAVLEALYPEAAGDDVSGESHVWEAGLTTYTGVTHWVPVAERMWRAWTGPRRVDGEDHHGPVWNLDTDVLWDGPRDCACPTCAASTRPPLRHN